MSNETADRTENQVENKVDNKDSADSVLKEANAGKAELVDDQKQHDEFLKAGGKSGITNEFGKPELIDQGTPEVAAALVHGEGAGEGKGGAKESIIDDIAEAAQNVGEELVHTGESVVGGVVNGVGSIVSGVGEVLGDIGETVQGGLEAVGNFLGNLFHGQEAAPKPEIRMEPLTVRPEVPYSGEDLKMDMPPSQVTGTAADTLESIARMKLPAGATEAQVHAYEKEIASVNGLNPAAPGSLDGKQLDLPGATADGGMVLRGDNERTITRWPNGAEKTVDKDGREYSRQPDGAGGYKEIHTGPRKDDNFELTTTPDGRLLIADKPGDTPREVPCASEEAKVERHKLLDLAAEKIKDPERRAKFEADMLRFEERAAQHKPPLSGEEIARTYKETERLLTTVGDNPIKAEDRVKLAEQVMAQCASPKSIDQGQHQTCNMTTVECTVYTNHPSDAARLVADIAITGQYTAKDGTQVNVSPEAADKEAIKNPPGDGDRSQASQIFQVAAVNLYYQKQPYTYTDAAGNPRVVPPGQLQYVQQPDSKPGVLPPTRGGERLIDNSTVPPTPIMRNWTSVPPIPEASPDIADRAMVDVPAIITGVQDVKMIEHKTAVYGDATGVNLFETEDQMKDYIKKAQENNELPLIIGVHTGQEPFLHDSGDGAAGGSGGWHVVTITGYDEATGKCQVDNQWGSRPDHEGTNGVHVHDLFRASRKPDLTEVHSAPIYKFWEPDKVVNVTIEDLQKDVDWDRAHNTVDTQKEFELLRLKRQYGGMSEADYDKDLKQTVQDAAARWAQQKADGTFDVNEYNNAQTKLKDMLPGIPPERRVDILDQMHTGGMLDDATYTGYLRLASNGFFAKGHTDAQAEAFMNKIKASTDTLDAAQQEAFYNQLNAHPNPAIRLELAQFEKKAGAIDDAKYDDLVAKTTTEFLGAPRTPAASTAYMNRVQAMLTALPEARRNAILTKVPGLAPAPAGP